MRTLSYYAFGLMALAVVLASAAEPAPADEPVGVARISDGTTPASAPERSTLPVIPASAASMADQQGYPSGDGNTGDGTGVCPYCGSRHGDGGQDVSEQTGSSGGCRHFGSHRCRLFGCGLCGLGNNQCAASSWDVINGPAIHPIVRIPVTYQRWLPNVWYGDPRFGIPPGAPVAPMIYMPTDTTQLGYYYQRVPTWVPYPGMLPAPPNAAIYHRFGPPAVGIFPAGGTVNGGMVGGECPATNGKAGDSQPAGPQPTPRQTNPGSPGIPPRPGV